MRFVLIILASIAIAACSKAPKQPIPDFTPYLHLKPGTRIKLTPYIETGGPAADLPAVRDAMRQTESGLAVTGTLTAITKTQLSIRPDNQKHPDGFSPSGVRSIEVLADQTAKPNDAQ